MSIYFWKKLCIREQIECVDAYELFMKQGNVLKLLFDNTTPQVSILALKVVRKLETTL